jgi:hypothetical protein
MFRSFVGGLVGPKCALTRPLTLILGGYARTCKAIFALIRTMKKTGIPR